jgi:hypothetical protein
MVNKKKVKVTKIEPDNIKEFDNKIPTLNGIVLFHHPGCIHCIMLKPKWEMMKKKIKSEGEIMEVNAQALEKSTNPIKSQIDGFPTIVRISNGKITDKFAEERNIENMLRFVTKHFHDSHNKLDFNYKLNKHNNIKKIKLTKKNKNKKRKTKKN